MSRRSNDQTMKQAVESMLKEFRLDDKLMQVKIVDSWEKIMGAAVASRTQEVKIIGRKFFVILTSASLRQELFMEREKILNLLNEEAGSKVIDEVIFQ